MSLLLLKQTYNRDNYLDFLADKFKFSKNLAPISIENNDVKFFQRLGTITTHDDKELPVFEIYIKPNTQLSRNRVQLRNLVAKQIQTEDGALAVYIDADNQQWRFSFIAIEYSFSAEGIKKEQTASKRFTYLFGENTKTRTAEERFKKLNNQSTLQDLKEDFAVEALNKEFYDKLYRWYEKAHNQVTFPNDEKMENHIQTSLIRLLTRLLFIWFIKEKKLINPDLFNQEKLQNLIDYNQPSSFYKAILQNLFFATLNVEINKRDFRDEEDTQGANKDYGNQYRYRYHALVKNKGKWKSSFTETPFLNGGLFESLDKKLNEFVLDENNNTKKNSYGDQIINQEHKKLIDDWNANTRPEKAMIRMEGFSEHKKNPLKISNQLFFNNDENDLGLIDLFNQYQFTVEESTSLDIEVALDPELLGKVFENLLASSNPETGQQARKATGSFYTPREIVNYMVDESLKAYFYQHTDLTDKQINTLFDESEFTKQKNTLSKQQTITLIHAIDKLKILDPAVGSGAYPMGVLQRLVLILEKVDTENTHFKQQQIDKAQQIPDEASRTSAIAAIEQVFSQQNQHNAYGKKLMLIENCIYGVDIQPIAIQICKLRFFISLTVEQTPNQDKADNYTIKALPNLETKFIVANSLLPLGEMPTYMFKGKIEELQQQLAKIRHKHFSAKTLKTKHEYRNKDKQLRQELSQLLREDYQQNCVWAEAMKIVDTKTNKLIKNKKHYQNKIDGEKQRTFSSDNTNRASDKEQQNWQDKIIDLEENIASEKKIMLLISHHDESLKKKNIWGKAETTAKENAEKFYARVRKIANWDLYNQNAVADWFHLEWQFGVKNGFDIVIGNPPYAQVKRNVYAKTNFPYSQGIDKGKQNLYKLFVELSHNLCKNNGVATMIVQSSLMGDLSSAGTRQLLLDKTQLKHIIEFPKMATSRERQVFNSVTQGTCIYQFIKQSVDNCTIDISINNDSESIKKLIFSPIEKATIHTLYPKFLYFPKIATGNTTILQKIANNPSIKPLSAFIQSMQQGDINLTAHSSQFSNELTSVKLMRGRHVGQYTIKYEMVDEYIVAGFKTDKIQQNQDNNFLISQQVTGTNDARRLHFAVKDNNNERLLWGNSVNKTLLKNQSENHYFMALLNAKFMDWYFRITSSNNHVQGYEIEQLPIPKISKPEQQPFIDLVDKILTAKQHGQDTSTLETEIDKMVYKLYDLTEEEIKIIEGEK